MLVAEDGEHWLDDLYIIYPQPTQTFDDFWIFVQNDATPCSAIAGSSEFHPSPTRHAHRQVADCR